jgi:two-component system LytT family sensor kinase
LSGIMIIGAGLHHVIPWVVGYLAYAAVRELTIRRMQDDPGSNTLLIQVSDKLSSFFLIYFSVGCILLNFDVLFTEFSLTVFYFLLLPPAILTAYSNIYWVFPQKKDGKLLRGWSPLARRRLLISIISWPIPFFYYGLVDGHVVLPALISFWLAQLAITTPVSWYIYRRWKEKLFQLHGLQTALGQSEADLQFLRSQINPHFLFNVLNTLYGTALQEDASRTAAGVQRLGDMMRFMLHENHLQHIPMAKEVDYLKNYIALQELRTESSEAIHIETVIDETFPDFQIAPMLLIPFVENGFKHGISLREPSWIKLRLESQGNSILFEMRNSIHTRKGDDPEKARSGIGLKNVLHRLKLLYPDRHEFYMHQDEKEFFVQLSIQP